MEPGLSSFCIAMVNNDCNTSKAGFIVGIIILALVFLDLSIIIIGDEYRTDEQGIMNDEVGRGCFLVAENL